MPGITFRENDQTQTAGPDSPLPIRFRADAAPDRLVYVLLTLSAVPETVTTIEIPDWASGFRLWPQTEIVRFAIDEDPEVPEVVAGAAILAADHQVGGIARGDQEEVRQLANGSGRVLHLRSAVASVAVDVEFF